MDSIVYAAFTSQAGGVKFQVLDFVGTLVLADRVHEVQSYLSDPEALEQVVEARTRRGIWLVASEEAGNVSCYHRNVPGDVVRLTGENGSVIQQYNYGAFGVGAGPTSEIPLLLLRGVFSPGIWFYYLRARCSNPSIGKFISKNPERDRLNWYIYDNNNPVMFTDRTRLPIILRGITNKNMIRFIKMTRDM